MAVVGVAVIIVLVSSCLVWTARLLSIGMRDAQELAAKLSVPHPRSAAQWPELQIDGVIGDVDASDHLLLVVRWPANPSRRALLVVESRATDHRRLTTWCNDDARLSPISLDDTLVSLRRRRSGEQVEVHVLEETSWTDV